MFYVSNSSLFSSSPDFSIWLVVQITDVTVDRMANA